MTENTLPLTKRMLEMLLVRLSHLLTRSLRLVVHGGACMLLHPGLERIPTQRLTTMDIDYIHRGVISEYGTEAAADLLQCIYMASLSFPGLGADWMNSEADISLPLSPQIPPYDPVYHASIQQNNVDLHTIYTSPNNRLVLVSVTPFWGVALKLVRYSKYDMVDICALLRNGTRMRGVKWTPDVVERWLRTECTSMRYDMYDAARLSELRQRIHQVVSIVQDAPWLRTQGRLNTGLSDDEKRAMKIWEERLRPVGIPSVARVERTNSIRIDTGESESQGDGDLVDSSSQRNFNPPQFWPYAEASPPPFIPPPLLHESQSSQHLHSDVVQASNAFPSQSHSTILYPNTLPTTPERSPPPFIPPQLTSPSCTDPTSHHISSGNLPLHAPVHPPPHFLSIPGFVPYITRPQSPFSKPPTPFIPPQPDYFRVN